MVGTQNCNLIPISWSTCTFADISNYSEHVNFTKEKSVRFGSARRGAVVIANYPVNGLTQRSRPLFCLEVHAAESVAFKNVLKCRFCSTPGQGRVT